MREKLRVCMHIMIIVLVGCMCVLGWTFWRAAYLTTTGDHVLSAPAIYLGGTFTYHTDGQTSDETMRWGCDCEININGEQYTTRIEYSITQPIDMIDMKTQSAEFKAIQDKYCERRCDGWYAGIEQ